jgi:multiple sugar transport system permease protein
MHQKIPLLFLTPALLFMIILVLFPILNTIYISFLSLEGEFVGLENYANVMESKDIFDLEGFPKRPPLGAFIHNMIWIFIHLPLSIVSGLILAIILRDVRGSSVVKTLVFLGMVTPMVVGGLIIRYTFEKDVGVVNGLLSFVGLGNLARSWTAYPDTALFALIFGSVWLWTGFSMILYSAGLATIPKDYYEAAKIDGAGVFKTFFRITLPLLRPITVTVVTMTILYELKIFDVVLVATYGGPGKASSVLAFQMWLYAFRYFQFNRAAVVASLLTVLTTIVTIPMIRFVVKR